MAAPPSLKSVQPFLIIAKQFVKRDPVVSYYAMMYAVQEGIKQKDPAAKAFLLDLMDQLGKMKATLKDEEALQNEIVARAHIEEVALRLFDHADQQDRQANFNKGMIKSFFTAAQLFTTLKQFGELSDEVEEKMKYAKWKAVEIDRCLKSGVTPTPGPPGGDPDDISGAVGGAMGGAIGFNIQPSSDLQPNWDHPEQPQFPPPPGQPQFPPPLDSDPSLAARPVPKKRQNIPHHPQPPEESSYHAPVAVSGAELGPEGIRKAQKMCKFASSALDYDDIQGALDYLAKAMKLLQTGKED